MHCSNLCIYTVVLLYTVYIDNAWKNHIRLCFAGGKKNEQTTQPEPAPAKDTEKKEQPEDMRVPSKHSFRHSPELKKSLLILYCHSSSFFHKHFRRRFHRMSRSRTTLKIRIVMTVAVMKTVMSPVRMKILMMMTMKKSRTMSLCLWNGRTRGRNKPPSSSYCL